MLTTESCLPVDLIYPFCFSPLWSPEVAAQRHERFESDLVWILLESSIISQTGPPLSFSTASSRSPSPIPVLRTPPYLYSVCLGLKPYRPSSTPFLSGKSDIVPRSFDQEGQTTAVSEVAGVRSLSHDIQPLGRTAGTLFPPPPPPLPPSNQRRHQARLGS